MDRQRHTQFQPSSLKTRCACFAAAVAASLATLLFIDALAHGYAMTEPPIVQSALITLAQR